MTDNELAKQCMAGDAEAQKELWKLYSRKMMAVCIRYCGNRDDAEDVLQDAFVKVFQKLSQWQGSGPLGGWIRTVVVNTNLTFLRDRRKKFVEQEINEHSSLSDLEPTVLDSLGAEALNELIASMPEGYRTVFNLFAVEGYSHREIGESLGISENTSKTQFLKAKNWLRKKIKPHLLIENNEEHERNIEG
jgi:RNA polymerase sigma factor (sigma-70 family)